MLTGRLVRVKQLKNRCIVPARIDLEDALWQDAAGALLDLFAGLPGRTRDEMQEEIDELVGDHPQKLIYEGLAELCMDRCEFEIGSALAPEQVREAVFRAATDSRRAAFAQGIPWDRDAVIAQVATELHTAPNEIEAGLFADLHGEQRIVSFRMMTPEQLLHRYNVALVQAILLRSTGVDIVIREETVQRFRRMCRTIKFHRLIATIRQTDPTAYHIRLDGPLSLFSATQKYGLQLALFFPALLQCRNFEMRATIRWGPQRVEKILVVTHEDGYVSHLPDYGDYIPKDIRLFIDAFAKHAGDWSLSTDPELVPLGTAFWVPDLVLTHTSTGGRVLLEIIGFWRRVDVEQHLKSLQTHVKEPFLLAVAEANRIEHEETALDEAILHFRTVPLSEKVIKRAEALLGIDPATKPNSPVEPDKPVKKPRRKAKDGS